MAINGFTSAEADGFARVLAAQTANRIAAIKPVEPTKVRRPGYREAVEWLAGNDDCYWLGEQEKILSVSASMVRDLYGVTDERLTADIRRTLKKVHPTHEVLR